MDKYKFIHYPIEFYYFIVEDQLEFHYNSIQKEIFIKINDEYFYLTNIYDNVNIPNFIHNNPLLNMLQNKVHWTQSPHYMSSLIQISMIETLYHNSFFYENKNYLQEFELRNKDNVTIQSFPLHYIHYQKYDKLYLLPLFNTIIKSLSYYQYVINDIVKIFVPINELCSKFPNRIELSNRFNQIQQLFHIIKPFKRLFDDKNNYQNYVLKSLTLHYKFNYQNIEKTVDKQILPTKTINIVCIAFSLYDTLDDKYIQYFYNYYSNFVSKIVIYSISDIKINTNSDKCIIKKINNNTSIEELTELINNSYVDFKNNTDWICITNITDYFVIKKKNNNLYSTNEFNNIFTKLHNYTSIQSKVIQCISSQLHSDENNNILLNQMNKGLYVYSKYVFFNLKYLERLNFDKNTYNFQPEFNKQSIDSLIKDNFQIRNIEFVGNFEQIQKRINSKRIITQSKYTKQYYTKLLKSSVDLL